ncbi:unnamed protein product [Haemonchus placei]|uniref:Lipoprotein n=1 Tax=Haemonchus placei TaxID=6290 RepID=A0A158QK70_HAEPC|nr:unnamed protein product [Haemonchus placei]
MPSARATDAGAKWGWVMILAENLPLMPNYITREIKLLSDAGKSTTSTLPQQSTSTAAPTTTTPLPMTSYALTNDKTVVDGKLLLQRSVALSSEVQR